jgi:hypothetical protein
MPSAFSNPLIHIPCPSWELYSNLTPIPYGMSGLLERDLCLYLQRGDNNPLLSAFSYPLVHDADMIWIEGQREEGVLGSLGACLNARLLGFAWDVIGYALCKTPILSLTLNMRLLKLQCMSSSKLLRVPL